MRWMTKQKDDSGPVSAQLAAVIMGAVAAHLADEAGQWRLKSIAPLAPGGGSHPWAWAGRRDVMFARRYAAMGRRKS